MASWDFTIDSDKQNELAGKLSEAADNFDTKVSLLYGQIDSMNGTSWIGEDYDTFHTGVHNYEGALKDLSNGFRMFSEHYKLMAEGTNTLASDLINIIKNMTGTNGVDYSSSGGSASYGSGAGRSDVVGNDGNASSTHQSSSGATHGGGGRRFDDADDTSSSSSINNSSTPSKTITRGDMVPIGDKEYEYYGTAAEEFSPGVPNPNAGRNIYKDGNRYIFVDENGNIEPVQGYDGSEDNNLVDVTDDNIDHMKTLYYCSDIKNASESTVL